MSMNNRSLLQWFKIFGGGYAVFLILLGDSMAIRAQSMNSLIRYGRNLGAEEVESLERKLNSYPEDIGSRVQLFGYYSMGNLYGSPDQKNLEKAAVHFAWFTVNAPESEFHEASSLPPQTEFNSVLPVDLESIWLSHLEANPGNSKILSNALQYLSIGKYEEVRRACEEALRVNSDDRLLASRIGSFYLNSSLSRLIPIAERSDAAHKALALFEQVYESSSKRIRGVYLDPLAEASLAAEQWETAAMYAERLLRIEGDPGRYLESLNHGHVIRGIAVLNLGRKDEAKRHLLKSIQFPRLVDAKRFNPELSLARYLFLSGETAVIIEFLERCSKVFSRDSSRFSNLKERLQDGELDIWELQGRY